MTDSREETVLIVDDENINVRILEESLKQRYRVRTANDGRTAISAALDEPPDLVLLDVVMPEMSGLDVLRTLKEHDKTRNVPVMFVTGKDAVEDQTEGLSAGAVDYITKPFHMPIVLARVETHLKLKRKSDQLDRLASHDALTGIRNRRSFDELLKREWRRCARGHHELSLVMIDIDAFKSFNDEYGHVAGDDCLRTVGQAIASCVGRGEDFAARYGGEEFAVVLPETESKGAKVVAENIRRTVEELNIPHRRNSAAQAVTVSVGLAAMVPEAERPHTELVAEADRQLYRAKKTGRNRVRYDKDELAAPESRPMNAQSIR